MAAVDSQAQGNVWAWGNNEQGQLGDNSTINSSLPVQVVLSNGTGTLPGITAIAAGYNFSLALASNGTLWAWGDNGYGELGNGKNNNSATPVQVVGSNGSGTLTGITAISAGNEFSLALASNGAVWAWGSNAEGQLGNNATTGSSTPVQVVGSNGSGMLTGITAIAAGSAYAGQGFSLALASNGTVWAWGDNGYGELGYGTNNNSATPVQVVGSNGTGTLTGIVAIARG